MTRTDSIVNVETWCVHQQCTAGGRERVSGVPRNVPETHALIEVLRLGANSRHSAHLCPLYTCDPHRLRRERVKTWCVHQQCTAGEGTTRELGWMPRNVPETHALGEVLCFGTISRHSAHLCTLHICVTRTDSVVNVEMIVVRASTVHCGGERTRERDASKRD